MEKWILYELHRVAPWEEGSEIKTNLIPTVRQFLWASSYSSEKEGLNLEVIVGLEAKRATATVGLDYLNVLLIRVLKCFDSLHF